MATAKHTRATKAHSRSRNSLRTPPAVDALSTHPNDRTDNRIRAYIASIKPRKGVCHPDDVEAAQARGRGLIERLALSAEGDDMPQLRLRVSQVADVLAFITSVQPIEAKSWWRDDPDGPSHLVGYHLLLGALEDSLREAQPNEPSTWPVVWRVVAPAAGSYDHDMTFLETEDEAEAQRQLEALRCSGSPVRLERVQCGPMPRGSQAALSSLRAVNAQNPGAAMRDVLGSWEMLE